MNLVEEDNLDKGWKVVAVTYMPDDLNWKVQVAKGTARRTVYFYHEVFIGEIVGLRKGLV